MKSTRCLRNVYDPVFMRKVKRTFAAYKQAMDHSNQKGMSREAFVDIDEKGAAWYLGHMQTATTELSRKVKEVDFVLEMRDARLPFSTENPNLRKILEGKPHLIIFNKAETANEDCNAALQQYYESTGRFALFTSAKRTWRDTVEAIQRFVTHVLPTPQFRTTAQIGLVVGMPNVGKSTLINSLRLAHEYQFHREDFRRSRTPETVAITPGTTRGLKLVPVCRDPNVVLYDTPGLTLPGVMAREASVKLAACGIVPTNDISLTRGIVARYLFDVMVAAGSTEHLAECLHLPRAPVSFDDCIALICERSGRSGQTELGNLDPVRAQRFLIHDFQMGRLGRITLDRIPRRVRAHLNTVHKEQSQITEGYEENHQSHSEGGNAAHDEEGDDPDDESKFTWTHHVETQDVEVRYPDHMRDVMDALRGQGADTASTSTSTNTNASKDASSRGRKNTNSQRARPHGVATEDMVISRRKGPISRASALDDTYNHHIRLRPGR